MKESVLQKKVIDEIKARLPGAIVIKNDADYIQGYPDLSVHYNGMFALLETKQHATSSKRPNQEFYISKTNDTGGFARFINQENKDVVLDELERTFKTCRVSRTPEPQ